MLICCRLVLRVRCVVLCTVLLVLTGRHTRKYDVLYCSVVYEQCCRERVEYVYCIYGAAGTCPTKFSSLLLIACPGSSLFIRKQMPNKIFIVRPATFDAIVFYIWDIVSDLIIDKIYIISLDHKVRRIYRLGDQHSNSCFASFRFLSAAALLSLSTLYSTAHTQYCTDSSTQTHARRAALRQVLICVWSEAPASREVSSALHCIRRWITPNC